MNLDDYQTDEWQAYAQLLSPSDDGAERRAVDVAVDVDDVIAELQERGRLQMAVGRLQSKLDEHRTDHALVMAVSPMDPLPEGLTWRAWLTWLLERANVALVAPGSIPRLTAEERHPRLWRHTRQSRYLRDGMADRLVELVTQKHAEEIDAWIAGTHWQGWNRVHLSANLSDHVEELGGPGATAIGESAPLVDGQLDVERAEPVVHGVVVLNHGAVSGAYEAYEAHPEIQLDMALRQTYPDLCHWFGGFQSMHGTYPSVETYAANRSTSDPARSKVRDQLTLLLMQDDAAIHDVLVATGSYTAPSGPLARHWVDRQLWRLDAWDWSDPRA